MTSKASIFNIKTESHDNAIKFLFYDNDAIVRINSFDFTGLDTSTKFAVDFTIIRKSDKLTNFQFKKRLKRTIDELLSESLTSYINTTLE